MKIKSIAAAIILCGIAATSGLAENSAVIPTPRTFPTNWMTRHQEFVAQAKRGGVDLLFIGDSITDGWHWEKGGAKVWESHYAARKAADFGIGYDRTQNVLWRLRNGELDGIKPRVVVLLIGTNNLGKEDDGKPRNSTEEAAAGVKAIVKEIRKRLPRSKLLLFGIFPRGDKDDPARAQVKEVNGMLAKLDDGKHVKFLDIGDKFLEPDGTLPRNMFPDLLHPNEKGYEIWSGAIDSALADWLK